MARTVDTETGADVGRSRYGVVTKLDGLAHSFDDEPSYIGVDGDRFWARHGRPHRFGGPSHTQADGTEIWQVFEQLHRDGGKPARTDSTGRVEYAVMGVKYPTAEAAAKASAEQIESHRLNLYISGGMTPEAIASRRGSTVDALVGSPDVVVRQKLARNPGATDATLDRLLGDKHPQVREIAQFNIHRRERLRVADAEDAAAREF